MSSKGYSFRACGIGIHPGFQVESMLARCHDWEYLERKKNEKNKEERQEEESEE